LGRGRTRGCSLGPVFSSIWGGRSRACMKKMRPVAIDAESRREGSRPRAVAQSQSRSPRHSPLDTTGSIMRKTHLLALTAVSAALLAQGIAHGTTLPYKGVDKLVAEADGIVIGTVRQVQSAQDSQKDIETYVTLDNLKVLGGRYAAPTLTLRLKGGR